MKSEVVVHISSKGIESIEPIADSEAEELVVGEIIRVIKPCLDVINLALRKNSHHESLE